ncbi:MAG: hypothetical protein WKI04_00385 [Ferruginibacter sp.]
MAKRSGDSNYNTNLASEYLMMSLLCRAGKDAYLSLGNKKGVDIIVKTDKGAICVVEVKGVNKNNDWMIGNSGILPSLPNMFYALVGFEGYISDVNAPAKFYLIPSEKLNRSGEFKMSMNEKTIYLSHKYIRENYGSYLNTFQWLDEYLTNN